jgi:type IV pilus assembly protein PilO
MVVASFCKNYLLDFCFLAVIALGYFVVIKGQLDDIANAQAQEQSLLNEFKEKDSKLRNLQQYQAQLQEMEANFNQQLEQLPKETEIPSLVEDINLTGVNSGLKFKNIRLENEVKQEFLLSSQLVLKQLVIIMPLVLLLQGLLHYRAL